MILQLEVQKVLALLTNNSFLAKKKILIMPITQNSPDIDFAESNFKQKKEELLTKLLQKQKELANFLVETYPNNIDYKIHLMFMEMIYASKFDEYISGFILNEVMNEYEFAVLFASKLDDYLCQQAWNVNNAAQNVDIDVVNSNNNDE